MSTNTCLKPLIATLNNGNEITVIISIFQDGLHGENGKVSAGAETQFKHAPECVSMVRILQSVKVSLVTLEEKLDGVKSAREKYKNATK